MMFSIKSRKKMLYVLFLALFVWILEFIMFYIISFDFDFNVNEKLLIVITFGVFANLGGIIPSTSGGWGPFELIGSVVLISFGVPNEIAVAFTILTHLILWLPVSLAGLFLFLRDLKRHPK